MTDSQKAEIIQMRRQGISFSKIAEITGISRNTVKSFCRRKSVTAQCAEAVKARDALKCRQCGKPLRIVHGRKIPKFCSKECRTHWWNSHPEEVNRKAVYSFTCAKCGKPFTAYGNKNRRYCSHSCYIAARFGGGSDE